MKVIKYLAIGLGSLLALLVVAVGLIVAFFDPNDYKDDLQQLVKQQTGRDLTLQGDLKLSIYPWIALEFGPAALGNAPGFGSEPMVSIERARLGVKLIPLLSKRVEIGSVELTKPVVRLGVDARGRDNWSDLGSEDDTQAADTGGRQMSTSVARVSIVDGNIVYDDRQKDSHIALNALSVETGEVAEGRPVDFVTGFELVMDQSLRIATKLRSTVDFDVEQERYQLAAPTIELVLRGEGFPKDGLLLTVQTSELVADLKAQTLALPKLNVQALGATLTGDLTGRKILDAPSFSGPIALANVSLRELLPKLAIEVPNTADPKVLQQFAFTAQLAATDKAVQLNQLKLKLDDSSATGNAGIADLDSMAMRFDLSVDRINADRYLEPVPPEAAAGQATAGAAAAEPPIEIPVDLLRSLNLRGDLRVAEAVFADIQYSKLRMGINARDGRLRVFPSQAVIYGGQYSGDITLDASAATPRASFDEKITGLDFAPLFRDMFESKRISGRGNLHIKATAAGKDTDAMLRTLNGTLGFQVDNGAIEGTDLWYEIRRARALLKQQALPERTGPERTAFTALSASGKITNGVVVSDDIVAALQYLRVTGKGSTDIVKGELDYRLDATVLKLPPEGAGAEMADVVGFVVPVRITGALTDPKVRPDLGALAKAAVQQKIEEKKQEVEDKLKEQLQDKLKGLFER